MKRLLFFVFAAISFTACTQSEMEENATREFLLPDEISVSFENDDTRIYLSNGKTVWNSGDAVSVFYKSFDNLKWVFQGEDGDRTGSLVLAEGNVGKQVMDDVIIAYPFSNDYYVNIEDKSIEAIFPSLQHFKYDSYDPDSNLMIANSNGRDFVLRNVCGWLKLELTGNGETLKQVVIRGNNGEQIAGSISIDSRSAEARFASSDNNLGDDEVGGILEFESGNNREITLSCSRTHVILGENATPLYIALPPQVFENGISVDIQCSGYNPMTLKTNERIAIQRNHIKPMEVVNFESEESSVDASFTFDNIVVSTADNTITLDLIPSVKDMPYIIMSVDYQYIIDNNLLDDEALFVDDYNYFAWLAGFHNVSTVEYMNMRANIGDNYNVVINNAMAGHTYMVYAYYFDSKTGERLSDISRYYIEIEETETLDAEFDFYIETRDNGVYIQVDPANFTGDYFFDVLEGSIVDEAIENGKSVEECIAIVWEDALNNQLIYFDSIDQFLDAYSCARDSGNNYTYSHLSANTQYFLYAFRLNEGAELCSTPQYTTFITAE